MVLLALRADDTIDSSWTGVLMPAFIAQCVALVMLMATAVHKFSGLGYHMSTGLLLTLLGTLVATIVTQITAVIRLDWADYSWWWVAFTPLLALGLAWLGASLYILSPMFELAFPSDDDRLCINFRRAWFHLDSQPKKEDEPVYSGAHMIVATTADAWPTSDK